MTLELLELIFKANAARNQERLAIQKQIDIKLKIIKTLIRLCHDTKSLDQNKYLTLEGALIEIGKMLGGWIHKTGEPAKENPAN